MLGSSVVDEIRSSCLEKSLKSQACIWAGWLCRLGEHEGDKILFSFLMQFKLLIHTFYSI